MSQAPKIFLTYAREDRDLLEPLFKQLKPLLDNQELTLWVDQENLQVGEEDTVQIAAAIEESQYAIIALSPSFFASDFIVKHELPHLHRRWSCKAMQLLPLFVCSTAEIVRPVRGEGLQDIHWRRIHGLNAPNELLEGATNVNELVTEAIRRLRQCLKGPPGKPPPPDPPTHCDTLRAREALQRLHTQKSQHDALHRVQITVQPSLQQQALRPDVQQVQWEDVSVCERTLATILAALDVESSDDDDTRIWAGKLRDVCRTLDYAAERQDLGTLKKAARTVDSVLSQYPTLINGQMRETAAILLREIDTMLQQKSVPDVTALKGQLFDLVRQHNAWQSLDLELHRIWAQLPHRIEELIDSWPEYRKNADEKFQSVLRACAEHLTRKALRVDDAIRRGHEADMRDCFRGYRADASVHFYGVDRNFMKLCDRLSNSIR